MRGLARLDALGHASLRQILHVAGRETAGDADGHQRGVEIQSHQAGGGQGRAKHAAGGGRVKAAGVHAWRRGRIADPAGQLVAGGDRRKQRRTASSFPLGYGQAGRPHHDARMGRRRRVRIVHLHAVGRDSVDEGRHGCGQPLLQPESRRFGRAAHRSRDLPSEPA